MAKILPTLFIFLVLLTACQLKRESSKTHTSREARSLIGAAEDFDPETLAALDEAKIAGSWAYQREKSWALWSDLNENVSRQRATFVKWQTWYSKEDLLRVFHHIYGTMTREERAIRRPFTAEQIEAGLKFHDEDQFLSPDWKKDIFEKWFAKYDNDAKKTSLTGINKVLMNKTALVFFLQNYAAIDRCTRLVDETCPALQVPAYAAFLKTAWRRGQDDFLVPYYQTTNLTLQFAGAEWTSQIAKIPEADTTYRIETPTGQIFHLTAVHLALKLKSNWFWTSLWLDEASEQGAAVKPSSLPAVWNRYQLCSVVGFQGVASSASEDAFERQIAENEAKLGSSWCSNPYLEGGINNHQTNCIGCHQHAGKSWTEDDFNDRLQNNLALVTQKDPAQDHSKSDFVWSLFNGPEPFASFISQEVDYFDAYDSF